MFDIDLFSSYWDFGQQQIIRYGYKGLIPAQNEASGFFIIALFYFANATSTGHKNALPKFILVWIAMVLTGTKACLVAFPILLLYILYWLKRRKNAALPMLGITIIAVFCSLYYIDFIMDEIAISIGYFTQSLARNKSNMITVISSGRNFAVMKTLSYIFKNLRFSNVLFGGHDTMYVTAEVDPVDILLKFGVILGIAFYLWYFR